MKILTIVVTYNPDTNLLYKLLSSLDNQKLNNITNEVIIIDNGSSNLDDILALIKNCNHNIELECLNENKGIAYAQNIGLKKAIKENFNYAMLSDQDTIYPANYIKTLLESFRGDSNTAAIGAIFTNSTLNKVSGYVPKIKFGLWKTQQPTSGTHTVKQLIASGKIINIALLSNIGLMNEDLFIDYVDLEWCWRAVSRGYNIKINADIMLIHQLGDEKVQITKSRSFALRTPLRYYFIIRNGIYLSIHNPNNILTPYERFIIFSKSLVYLFTYSIYKPRLKNMKYGIIGLNHGILKKLGNSL